MVSEKVVLHLNCNPEGKVATRLSLTVLRLQSSYTMFTSVMAEMVSRTPVILVFQHYMNVFEFRVSTIFSASDSL